MCGIFCTIHNVGDEKLSNEKIQQKWIQCEDVIKTRGPDNLSKVQRELSGKWHGQFHASVLWMQGSKPVLQPLIDDDGNILLWNGDVFSGKMENICDSEMVLENLKNTNDVYSTMNDIKGPFSFIYYKKFTKELYFGRDRYGRHSLLFNIDEDTDSLLLSSVAVKDIQNVTELPAVGIYIIDLNKSKMIFKCLPWNQLSEKSHKALYDLQERYNIKMDIIESDVDKKMKASPNNILNLQSGFLKYTEQIHDLKNFDEIMTFFLEQEIIYNTVNSFHELLNESVRRRVQIIPKYCRNCTKKSFENNSLCQHGKVGLLFSGGLDSAILTVLAHNNIHIDESIDLINVAFQKKNNNFEVPDRKTGRQTLNELLEICPGRQFNFIEVNVTHEELEKYRSTRISNLVYPHATVLDDSLACAVWFAGRGKGTLYPTNVPYESSSRVLLLGMGADEQFGGYMRHRTILKHKGWAALIEELDLDFQRISERNLGRDDRMVADHGRQSRLPYLDEDCVEFIQSLSPWERCCPTEKFPPGLGDKLLLRLLARKIGLHGASKFPKRAFQFGSRIADGKENAKDISKRL